MSRWHPFRSTRCLAGKRSDFPFTRRLQFRPMLLELEGRVLPATLTVTNLSDHDPGSLRAEIGLAQNGDTINFAAGLSGRITLTSGELELHRSVTVQGPGASQISVSGNNASRVFELFGGATVTLSGLTVTSGRVTGGIGGGLLVDAGAALTINNSTISSNSAGAGGGLVSLSAIMSTIDGCTITGNSAVASDGNGGGVASFGGVVRVSNSTINNNTAPDGGGGIDNDRGTLTVSNVTISGNSSYGGGGVFNVNGAMVTVSNSTFSGNSTRSPGGGIWNYGGAATVSASTLSGNSAGDVGGAIFSGGALTVSNSTISGNSAGSFGGGGIFIAGGTGTVTASTLSGNSVGSNAGGSGILNEGSLALRSTIVAANRLSSEVASDIAGSNVDSRSAYNLIGTGGAGGLTNGANGNLVGVADPGLAPLADNGGPTKTMALIPGSPAIGAGDPALGGTTDQRGVTRRHPPSIGAYEYSPQTLTVTTLTDSGAGSLRDALNRAGSFDVITFAPALTGGTITITSGELPIVRNVTVQGLGATSLTVSGSGGSRIFEVLGGATAYLSGLTITGGRTTGTNHGGGILADMGATLTVSNCIIVGNSTAANGAFGGGIFNSTGGTLTVTNSTLSGNFASNGGAIANGGMLTVTNSTLSGNSASNGSGGGINMGGGAVVIINHSTLSNNSALIGGGGIYNDRSMLTVANSTLSGNSALYGGAIANGDGTLTVSSSTISGNSASGTSDPPGGGIFAVGMLTLQNTIVAANRLAAGGASDLAGNNADSRSAYNLIGTGGSGGLTNGVNGNIVGIADPRLAPLADNGGPTQTMALLAGSLPTRSGDPALAGTVDQRGVTRHNLPSIGAYEAPPQNFTVTNLNDSGPGSLRDALTWAYDNVVFANGLAGQITLTSGELELRRSIAVQGPGANLLRVSGNNASRVFEIFAGAHASLTELTITGGRVTDLGGGVLVDANGILSVSNCILEGNTASGTYGSGGSIFTAGTLTMSNCILRNNSAVGTTSYGGGIVNIGGLTVSNSTFSGNSAVSTSTAYGGAIVNNGTFTMSNSTISGNSAAASGFGGGIYNTGTLTVSSSTFNGNSAAASGFGGGILNDSGTLTVSSSTFNGNSAAHVGGGILNNRASGPVTLRNTIVAANLLTDGTASDIAGFNVDLSSAYNLIGIGGSGGLVNGQNGNLVGIADSRLGPLADNGGSTQTIALLSGSPAIGAGDPSLVNTLDQRGVPRTGGVNIGAYQASATTFLVAGFPSPVNAGVSGSVTVTAHDPYGNTAPGYRGAIHFTSSDPQASLPVDYTFVTADYGVHSFSVTLKTAGSQSLTATDTAMGSLTGTQAGIQVNPAAASTLSVAGFPSPAAAGVPGNLTVTARDPYGNVSSGYRGTVHITSSDRLASLPADYTFTTADNGVHTLAATMKTAGTQSLTATDTITAMLTSTQSGIVVNPASASHLDVMAPVSTTAGSPFSITATARDPFNNVATGYRGTIHFTLTNPDSCASPPDYAFTASDNGTHTFSITLWRGGSQVITVRDTNTITGSATINVTPIYAVSNANDSGPGSLRQAIMTANCNPSRDTVTFNIPGSGAKTITVASELPTITDPVVLDATTQPGYAGQPLIELDGEHAGNAAGFRINAGNTTIKGFTINRFSESGLILGMSGGDVIQGNYIGTNAMGTAALGNTQAGILISNIGNNTIGGTTAATRNVIAGNGGSGIDIVGAGASNNVVQGNYIGTNVAGTAPLANAGAGVTIDNAPNNTIGGTDHDPGACNRTCNVIAGNTQNGVLIINPAATGNLVQGNLIGTNAAGTARLGNGDGVYIAFGAVGNLIGGATAGSRNIISGNQREGVHIENPSGTPTGDLVQGNYIGLDITGTLPLSNASDGVALLSGPNTIGGSTVGARNVISANGAAGIILFSNAVGNVVQGNWIGTDAAGTLRLGNAGDGVNINGVAGNLVLGNVITFNGISGVHLLNAPNNTIGGTGATARNVISGNGGHGVFLDGASTTGTVVQGNFIGTTADGSAALGNAGGGVFGLSAGHNTIGGTAVGAGNVISANVGGVRFDNATATGNVVQGNYIGTDATGRNALGSRAIGVQLADAPNNLIGGTAVGAGNLIAGSQADGVLISGAAATGNVVQGNFIGTDVTGQQPLGNARHGVSISGASGNRIVSNTIAFSGGSGVLVDTGTGNAIQGNVMFGDTDLGIHLVNGGNDDQAAPVITKAVADAASTRIKGTLTSMPDTTFTLEFFANSVCHPSGYGEAEILLGTLPVATDENGQAPWSFRLDYPLPVGYFVSATATSDATNDTSEFAACVAVKERNGGSSQSAGPLLEAENPGRGRNVSLVGSVVTGSNAPPARGRNSFPTLALEDAATPEYRRKRSEMTGMESVLARTGPRELFDREVPVPGPEGVLEGLSGAAIDWFFAASSR